MNEARLPKDWYVWRDQMDIYKWDRVLERNPPGVEFHIFTGTAFEVIFYCQQLNEMVDVHES